MKKLKVYKKCDFRLIDVHVEGSTCGTLPASAKMVKPEVGSDNDETESFDAASSRGVFPNGNSIWDN